MDKPIGVVFNTVLRTICRWILAREGIRWNSCEDMKKRLLKYWKKRLKFGNVAYLQWFLAVKVGKQTVLTNLFRNIGYLLDEYFIRVQKAFIENTPSDQVFGLILPCRLGYLALHDVGDGYNEAVTFILTAFNGTRGDVPYTAEFLKRLETLSTQEFQKVLDEADKMGFFNHFLQELHNFDNTFNGFDNQVDMSYFLFHSPDLDFGAPELHPRNGERVHPILMVLKVVELMNFGAPPFFKVITEELPMSEAMSQNILEQAYMCILVNVLWDGHAGMVGAKGM